MLKCNATPTYFFMKGDSWVLKIILVSNFRGLSAFGVAITLLVIDNVYIIAI